jgi:hypothetical protein
MDETMNEQMEFGVVKRAEEEGARCGGMGAATDGMESGRMDSEADDNRH